MENTAVVQIKPDLDPTFQALLQQTNDLQAYALSTQVDSPEGVRKATEDLSLISSLKRALESLRKSYTSPLDEFKRSILELFKVISGPLEEADAALRSKVKAYNKHQEDIRIEAARIEALRVEASERAARLAEDTGEPLPVELSLAPLPTAQSAESVETEAGSLNMRIVRKWRLVDFEKVPDKYKQLNEALITKVVKAGEPDIPGLELYTEKEPVITTRR